MQQVSNQSKKTEIFPKKKSKFRPNDYVVYPAHGVGKVISIENNNIVGVNVEMMVVSFEKEKMTLSIPITKLDRAGVRGISSKDIVDRALKTLCEKAKEKKAMWSKRAIEYSQKINSGDLVLIAEVVRDLHKGEGQNDFSFSEKQLYEVAFCRFIQEIAVAEDIDEIGAKNKVKHFLINKKAA